MLGKGEGAWDFVHVSDLADLYLILLKRVLAGEDVPVGEKGILFSASGWFRWREMAKDIADALFKVGALKTKEVTSINLEEAAKWAGGHVLTAELGFASK